MQSSVALRGASLRPSRQQRVAPRRAGRAGRVAPRAGLFDFFKPGNKGDSKKGNQRANELVEELLAVTLPTQAGDKASDAVREQVAALVDELEQYCPKAPLRSPLLWGEYEVVYAARPGTVAGPFKSPLGRVVFPGLESSQELRPPNVCVNKAAFKTLGFIPGQVKQEGYFEPIDGNSFKLIFPEQDGKKSGGPRERLITIAYLDERIRVARFTPAEDDEKSQPTFYVFTRKQQKQQQPEEEDEEEEAPAPAPAARFPSLSLGKKEGLATQVERSYYRSKGKEGTADTRRAGSPPAPRGRSARAAAAAPAPAQTAAEKAAERAAAREAAAREREAARAAAAEARAKAEAEKRAAAERQAAEREAARERAAAIKAQLAELTGEAQEAQAAARDAQKALKDAEKEASPLLRQAAAARAELESAVAAAVAAAAAVQGLKEEEKAAGREVDAARKLVRTLESLNRGGK